MPPQDGPSSCLVAPRTHHLLELSPSSSLPPASHCPLGSCSSSHYYLEALFLGLFVPVSRATSSRQSTTLTPRPKALLEPLVVTPRSGLVISLRELILSSFSKRERERERRPEYLGHFFLIFVAKRRLTKVLFK